MNDRKTEKFTFHNLNTIQREFGLLCLCTSLKYILVNTSPHRGKFYPLIYGRVLMGVHSSQLTIIFTAKYQLTAIFGQFSVNY